MPHDDDIQLSLRALPRLLCGVRSMVRCYLRDLGVEEARTFEVVLAVDEACTNSIRHSYDGDPGRRLLLGLASDAEWITVTLRDEGRPAPREKIGPPVPAPVDRENLHPGGLGIGLIYDVFDEVQFEPGDPVGNRLTMRLRRPAA